MITSLRELKHQGVSNNHIHLILRKVSEYDKEMPQSQTISNSRHPEEETQNTNCHPTAKRQLK